MPCISVIIPTYNRTQWLSTAIDSVLKQTFKDFELIVVDDASTDNTADILDSYASSLKSFQLPANKGVSAARNYGLEHSDSEWVAFLDSDDFWNPRKLEKQIQATKERAEFPVHFTDEIWIRRGKRVNPKKKHQKSEGWIYKPSLSLCLMAPSSIMIRRDILDITGKFDENLLVCEDYDLWLKITARYPVALLNEKLMTRHGGHEDQLSARWWGNDRYRVMSLQNILASVPLSPENKQATIAKLIEKCNILCVGFEKRGKKQDVLYYQNLIKKFIPLLESDPSEILDLAT